MIGFTEVTWLILDFEGFEAYRGDSLLLHHKADVFIMPEQWVPIVRFLRRIAFDRTVGVIRVFLKLYKCTNAANGDLSKEEESKLSNKNCPLWKYNKRPLDDHSNAFLTKLIWHFVVSLNL